MNTDIFAVFCSHIEILVGKTSDLFGIQRAITVDKIYAVGRRIANQFQSLAQIALVGVRYSHDIDSSLISLFCAIFHHLNCRRYGIDVARHSHHINDALGFWQNILLYVRSAYVRHDGNFQRSVVVADDIPKILFVAEFPFAEFALIKNRRRSLISKLHIIHPCLNIHLIQFLDEIVFKIEIIYKSSVS